MTIKKPIKNATVASKPLTEAEGGKTAENTVKSGGNVTMNSRFKLAAPDSDAAKKAAAAGKGLKAALIGGFIALIIVGVLTYTLWKHWEFLMPA